MATTTIEVEARQVVHPQREIIVWRENTDQIMVGEIVDISYHRSLYYMVWGVLSGIFHWVDHEQVVEVHDPNLLWQYAITRAVKAKDPEYEYVGNGCFTKPARDNFYFRVLPYTAILIVP
jgi:hypothetical protein